VHPLSEGGQGHEGHLSTGSTIGRGPGPLPIGSRWEAATPHRGDDTQPYRFFFFFVAFFFAMSRLTSSRREIHRCIGPRYFFFFFLAFFFMDGLTPLLGAQ
jgi:hypothetical protein